MEMPSGIKRMKDSGGVRRHISSVELDVKVLPLGGVESEPP